MLTWLKKRWPGSEKVVASPFDKQSEIPSSVQDLQPNDPTIYKSRGDDCLDNGDWHGAVGFYEQAIAIDPNYADARNNLALSLSKLDLYDEASVHLEKIIWRDNPKSFNTYYLAGSIFHRLGKFDKAIDQFNHAVSIKPDFAEGHSYLGSLYREKGDREKAFHAFLKAVSLDPENAENHFKLAIALEEQSDPQQAINCYLRTLDLSPDFTAARLGLVHQLQQICQWESLEEHTQLIRQDLSNSLANEGTQCSPFSFLALPGTTALEQQHCAKKWVKQEYAPYFPLREKLKLTFDRKPGLKIHIGYLSADFHDHATARLMAQVFELHDRSRFQISAYSYGPDDQSAMRHRIINAFDQFVDIRNATRIESAQRINTDKVDILVDLKGYTGNTRSAILALCPAPIQVNYLGYPGTMGAEFVDYLIADQFVIPADHRQYYSEQVVYLPDCYQPNDRCRPRPPVLHRTEVGLPEQGIVFCCLNQNYKIGPEMFEIWCRLLKAVPDSVLWVMASNPYAVENLKKSMEVHGIERRRLCLAPVESEMRHLARQPCADIFLDTLPYNAHTTCSDALWMGLPVVTCAGETFPSRVAGSLLSALDVSELITYNLEDYYSVALKLATDEAWRTEISRKIVENRDNAPLFDSKRFTSNLEDAYQWMWSRYCAIKSK